MSLTRSYLKSLGLDEEKVSSVIEAHSETVTALNGKYAELENRFNELTHRYDAVKADAEQLPAVRKELDEMRKEDYKARYESEKSAHKALKDSVAKKEARAAREQAVRAYYIGKSISGDNLTIAMRGTPLDEVKLAEDGTIADTKPLDDLVAGDFRPLIRTEPEPRRTVASGGSLAHGTPPDPTPSSVMNSLIRGR